MSLTNKQLRKFQDWDRHEGVWNSRGTSATCRTEFSFFVSEGLLTSNGSMTPAGRDALATVPYLVDPEPVAPAEPETVECSACDGQGARYVAKVCPLTLHERTILVACEAPGCVRGQISPRGEFLEIVDAWPTPRAIHQQVMDRFVEATGIPAHILDPATSSEDRPRYSEETLNLARSSRMLAVTKMGFVRVTFGKHTGRLLHRIADEYITWVLGTPGWSCSNCFTVFRAESQRRAHAHTLQIEKD